MIDAMTTLVALLAWFWGWLWYLANAAVAILIATVVQMSFAPGSTTPSTAGPLAPFAFGALVVFFWFVWPPIPKLELAIRDLLRRRRRKAGEAVILKHPETLIGSGSGQRPGELRLHVAEREITYRRTGEE